MNSRLPILEPKWLIVVVFFIAGIFLGGLVLFVYLNASSTVVTKIHPVSVKFNYINPLLAVDYPNQQFSQDTSLALQINGLINTAKKNNIVTDVGVYFRDIEPGLWVGINDGVQFSPGKLLKIPIMITYFKLAESNPEIFNEQLTYNGPDANASQLFPPQNKLKIGQFYTTEDLIERMIINSDDNAANLLFDNVDKDALNEIFSDLGISFREQKETPDFISLRLYSLFFRVLYNSTFLKREFSERALKLLVVSPSTDFGLGINLPKSIDFANRYGIYRLKEGGAQLFEMYDCGIVYYPNHPYLICAAIRGKSIDALQKFMLELSKIVFADIDYKYKQL